MDFTSGQPPLQGGRPWPPATSAPLVLKLPHSMGVHTGVTGSMLLTTSIPTTSGRMLKFSSCATYGREL
eukprot:12425426-Prorocentrum_lima.AAC.1